MERKAERAYITDGAVFASRLTEIMDKRGLNQTHLQAKILEQSGKTLQRQTISLYMNGQSKPDTERLTLLCHALDVSADYLLGTSDNPTRDESVDGACRCTGLSEKAVQYLHSLKESAENIESVSSILEAKQFHRFIKELEYVAIYLEQLNEPIEFLTNLNGSEPAPAYKMGPDGSFSLASGDPVMYSRMVNAQMELEEFLTELRVQLFEINKLWPALLEEIMPTEETIRAGKELFKKFNIR